MAERNFIDLIDGQAAQGHHLSVGVDIDWARVPEEFGSEPTEQGLFEYGRMVMDTTAHVAAMFKPNREFSAAYMRVGGLNALARLVEYSRITYPDIPVAIDAKQGDIGRTNEMALLGLFGELGEPDAITIHPWMGKVAMETHLQLSNKGFIVTAKTSNPGSGEFQDVPVSEQLDVDRLIESFLEPELRNIMREMYLDGGLDLQTILGEGVDPSSVRFRPFWQVLSQHVTSPDGWNANGNVGVVIGATYEEEARTARQNAHESPILSPGLGTQEGIVVDMRNSKGSGVVYNSASGIMLPKRKKIDEHGSVKAAIKNAAEATHKQIQEALGLA